MWSQVENKLKTWFENGGKCCDHIMGAQPILDI
jgi:hypothetical protein